MKQLLIITILIIVSFSYSWSFEQNYKFINHGHSIVEKNSWVIPVGDKNLGGINEDEFNFVIDKFEAIFIPYVMDLYGVDLKVIRDWQDPTVNAYAYLLGSTMYVKMYGGLARFSSINLDSFALVLCHETGHHIGGAPKIEDTFQGTHWASNEGQADYYAASKCMKRYFQNDDNLSVMADRTVDTNVVFKCAQVYSNLEDQARCWRISQAGVGLTNLFNDLRGDSTSLSFDSPDTNVVLATYDSHPNPQCRLDTYFQGALCDVKWDSEVSDENYMRGYCSRFDGHILGARPLCWFRPKEFAPDFFSGGWSTDIN